MIGQMTPEEFGRRLEDAAMNDRKRREQPNLVEYRHPVAGTLLIVGIVGIGAWLVAGRGHWIRRPRLGAPTGGASPASAINRLRPSVGLTFIGPAFFLYAALVIFPAASALLWAFTRWDGLGERRYSGLFNFKSLLFENDTIWTALRNNAFLMVVPALVVVPLALLFAALIHRGVAGGKLFRVIFLFPNMLGGIAATLLWLNAYEPHGGLINASLVWLGNICHSDWLRSFDGFPWLTPAHLYTALVPIYLWMACGFNLILYLAAMESVDPQLYEAAEIDGASKIRQFFSLTLPLIWDVIGISAVFLVIAGLNAFEMVWLLTSQDPDGSSHTLSTLLVTTMFKYFDIGRAAALAVLLLVLVLIASGAVLRLLKREAVEN
jgi:ABC-type sugar transport system permease subunit